MSLCYFTSGLISTEPRTNEPCESFRLVLHTPQGSAGRKEVLRVVEAEFRQGSRVDGCSALTKILMQSREQKNSCRDYDLLSHVRKPHTRMLTWLLVNSYGLLLLLLLLLLKLNSLYVNILFPISISYADAYTEKYFQNIVLFEHSNQPDKSSTNSVGLKQDHLISQPMAERASFWVNQKLSHKQYFWNCKNWQT